MTLLLDAGALVAVERGDRDLISAIKLEMTEGRSALTHAGIVGEVWRGGSGRQVNLARILAGVEVRAIDEELGRRAGVLLGTTGLSDVLDAAIVLLADDGDEIVTSDPTELRLLLEAADKHVDLIEP